MEMNMAKKTKYTAQDHTFVIGAYKESKYLKNCIRSLENQSVKSRILIATSTDNAYIRRLARQFDLPLLVNDAPSGIATDWNFAYRQAQTKLVTIAHQDDIYNPDYLEEVLYAFNHAENPILAHTAYYEIRNQKAVYSNRLLRVKKLLLLPFVTRKTWNSIFLRRRSLAFGCGICCPSVTYVKSRFPEEPFAVGCKADLDWEAWERYSKLPGAFCYVKKPVMGHRVHEDSETSHVIGKENGRSPEDYAMYRKFWPSWIAKLLMRFYQKGQDSNRLS